MSLSVFSLSGWSCDRETRICNRVFDRSLRCRRACILLYRTDSKMLNRTAFAPEVGIQGAILDNKMSGQLTMLLLQPLKPLPLGQLPSLPSVEPSSCVPLQFLSNVQQNVTSVWLRRREPRSPSCRSTRVAPRSFCEILPGESTGP